MLVVRAPASDETWNVGACPSSTESWQASGFHRRQSRDDLGDARDDARLQRLLHNDALSQSLMSRGAMYLVECSLETAEYAERLQ